LLSGISSYHTVKKFWIQIRKICNLFNSLEKSKRDSELRFFFRSDKILFKWNRLILFSSAKLISINFFKTKKKKKWYYNENLADKSQVEPSFPSRCLGSCNYSVYPSWPVMMHYEYWQDIWHIHFLYVSKRICLFNHAVSGSSGCTG